MAKVDAEEEISYDRRSMLGSGVQVYNQEDDDVPLLYFHSIPEAWVRAYCYH